MTLTIMIIIRRFEEKLRGWLVILKEHDEPKILADRKE